MEEETGYSLESKYFLTSSVDDIEISVSPRGLPFFIWVGLRVRRFLRVRREKQAPADYYYH